MRTTKEAIEQDLKELSEREWDSEGYHAEFDGLIESRLYELDPEYSKAMDKAYDESWEARRYA